MLLRRDVAKHRGAVPADHRGADRAGDVIVAGSDIGRERAERVERRFVRQLQLQVHVLLDEMHRHVAGTFDHDLAVMLPGDLRQFAQRLPARQAALRRWRRRSSPGAARRRG